MNLPRNSPVIYLITRGEANDANFAEKRAEILEIIRMAVEENVALVQIREKGLSARLLFELTVDAVAIIRNTATRLLVNDRADIAFAAGADGVHLAARSLSSGIVRERFPEPFIIGQSTHTLGETIDAAKSADFTVFGPVFETPSKDRCQGIAKLTEVCNEVSPFPVLAIGGMDGSNIPAVLEAGAVGIASIRALNNPDALRAICRKYRNDGVGKQ